MKYLLIILLFSCTPKSCPTYAKTDEEKHRQKKMIERHVGIATLAIWTYLLFQDF
jgi:hypothetical protein